MIPEIDIIHRSPRLDVRAHRGWPIQLRYDGTTVEHWVKPDRTLGAHFSDRPRGKNERYFVVEKDRGTMPIEPVSLDPRSRRSRSRRCFSPSGLTACAQ